ncbi:MAG: MFS transporter [Deltaproteobacteria bacterium]|nr:MFS transporter [Deltaproteobacteria bacterium]MBW2395306.1 MFS transporter [Deltaproteobacteria bacterium]
MARHPTLQVLESRELRAFLASRFLRSISQTGLAATLAWHLYEQTGSVFQLGMLGLVQFLPVLPIGLWAGAIADARERVGIVQRAQFGASLFAFGLAGFASWGAEGGAWPIFALAFLGAVCDAFENPASSAILPNLVAREDFPVAVTVVSAARNAAWASGPVLAGFVIAEGGIAASYALNGSLMLGSVAALAAMGRRVHAEEGQTVSWAAIREGLSFVMHRQPVIGCMALDLFAVIFAGVDALLPVFAKDILGAGPEGFGALSGAIQLGTFAMASVLLFLPPIRNVGRVLLVAVAGFGLATLLFAVSASFALSFAALFLSGMADQISMVLRTTIIQLSTPDTLRGRVSAVSMVFIGASNELGRAESGFLAALTSAVFSVLFGGAACLATVGVVAGSLPELRRFKI